MRPASRAASRSTRSTTASGCSARASAAVPLVAPHPLGEARPGPRVSAGDLLGGPGQRGRDPGSELGLEHRQHPVPDAGPGEARVVVVRVAPEARCPRRGRPPRSARGSGRAAGGGRRRTRVACRPASGRPSRGPARAARSRPGRRACARAAPRGDPNRSATSASTAYRASRAAASGPWPVAVTSTRTATVSATPRRGHLLDDPRGVVGRAVLEAVVDGDARRRAVPRSAASNTVAASSASESAPPEQATSTGCVRRRRASARRTARRTAATAGSSDMRGRVSRARGGPRPAGRRSRPWRAGSPARPRRR